MVANTLPTEPRLKIESAVTRSVLRIISETVIKETSLTIHADCDRNAASFPVPRQNRSNILRDNLLQRCPGRALARQQAKLRSGS